LDGPVIESASPSLGGGPVRSAIYDPARTERRNRSAEDSTGSAPVLRTEHLGRKVEGKTIVVDDSVEAWHGEVLAISSPSGGWRA
jgi:hypothetical protein